MPSSPPAPLLWQRVCTERAVVRDHLAAIRNRFRAAGWQVHQGTVPPTLDARTLRCLAVQEDPWCEPLAEVADLLARAELPPGQWRLPRVSGLQGAQGWQPTKGPYTLLEYEDLARRARRGRSGSRGAVAPGADWEPWTGFAVATGKEAPSLLAQLGEAGWPPASASCSLVPAALLFRYQDPAAHERRELDPWIPGDASTLVDIGCGHGLLGARHRRAGRQVVGIEPDPHLAGLAAQRLDLVLPTDALTGLAALRRPIDCAVFADVLEHVADPLPVLRRTAQHLAPGGRVVVSLPNSAWAPVLRALAAGRWDTSLAGVQARDHLVPFTPRSFIQLARGAGLEVATVQPCPVPLPWRLELWARFAAWSSGGRPQDLLAPQHIFVLQRP